MLCVCLKISELYFREDRIITLRSQHIVEEIIHTKAKLKSD